MIKKMLFVKRLCFKTVYQVNLLIIDKYYITNSIKPFVAI